MLHHLGRRFAVKVDFPSQFAHVASNRLYEALALDNGYMKNYSNAAVLIQRTVRTWIKSHKEFSIVKIKNQVDSSGTSQIGINDIEDSQNIPENLVDEMETIRTVVRKVLNYIENTISSNSTFFWSNQAVEELFNQVVASIVRCLRNRRAIMQNKRYKTYDLPQALVPSNVYLNRVSNGFGNRYLPYGYFIGLLKQNKFHGSNCELKFGSCKGKYFGSFKHGKRHGFGVFIRTTPLGDEESGEIFRQRYVYVGAWENDARHGIGVVLTDAKEIFLGQFVHGKISGAGISAASDGVTVMSDFLGNRYDGITVLNRRATLSCISKYSTEGFFCIKFSGFVHKGIISSEKKYCYLKFRPTSRCDPSFAIYYGTLSRGRAHGKGIMLIESRANSDEHSTIFFYGEYHRGFFHGDGCFRQSFYNDDKVLIKIISFKGEFVRGNFHGNGKQILKHFDKQNVTETYEGSFRKGKFYGQGRFVKISKSDSYEYKGCFVDGKKHGFGTLHFGKFPNEIRVMFTGRFKHGEMTCSGTMKYINGSICEGTFVDNLPHGAANRMTFANGDKYVGNFVHGRVEGEGMMVTANGDKYVGTFRDGRKNGIGDLWLNKLGVKYSGDFLQDNIHGKGRMIFNAGTSVEETYDGEFHCNVRQGLGKYVYKNGSIYIGEFFANKRNGQGKLTFSSGSMLEFSGDFQDGQMTGEGEATYRNGEHYIGSFEDGNKSGKGRLYFADGDHYDGNFVNDKMQGEGTIVSAKTGSQFDGKFFENEMSGYGRFKLRYKQRSDDSAINLKVVGF